MVYRISYTFDMWICVCFDDSGISAFFGMSYKLFHVTRVRIYLISAYLLWANIINFLSIVLTLSLLYIRSDKHYINFLFGNTKIYTFEYWYVFHQRKLKSYFSVIFVSTLCTTLLMSPHCIMQRTWCMLRTSISNLRIVENQIRVYMTFLIQHHAMNKIVKYFLLHVGPTWLREAWIQSGREVEGD